MWPVKSPLGLSEVAFMSHCLYGAAWSWNILPPAPKGTRGKIFGSVKVSWAINSRGQGSSSALISAARHPNAQILGTNLRGGVVVFIFLGNFPFFSIIPSRWGLKPCPGGNHQPVGLSPARHQGEPRDLSLLGLIAIPAE